MEESVLHDSGEDLLAGGAAHYRVRLRNADGSRTRAVNVDAGSRDAAVDVAMAEEPGDWEVLEVKRLVSGAEAEELDDCEESEASSELVGYDASPFDTEAFEDDAEDEDLPTPSEPMRARRWDPRRLTRDEPELQEARACGVETSPDSDAYALGSQEPDGSAPESASDAEDTDTELVSAAVDGDVGARAADPEDEMAHGIGHDPKLVAADPDGSRVYRVQIARGTRSRAALVWETSLASDSIESALTAVRSDLDPGWDVLAIASEAD